MTSTMPVRSFHIEDLLNYRKEDENKSVERDNKQIEPEINVIDVDDHQESASQTVFHRNKDAVDIVEKKNKKDRIYHSG